MASTTGYCSRLDEGSYQTPSLVVTSPQVPFRPSPPPSTSDSNLPVLPLLRNERRLRESKDSRTVTGLIVDHVSSFLLYFLYPYCNKLLYTYIYVFANFRGNLLQCETFDSTYIVASYIRKYRMFFILIFVENIFSLLPFFRSMVGEQ